MADKTKNTDQKSAPKPADPRKARLKAALKANMGRRKAQARRRAEPQPPETQHEQEQ